MGPLDILNMGTLDAHLPADRLQPRASLLGETLRMNLLKHETFPFKAKFNSSEKFLRIAVRHFEPFVNKKRRGDFVELYGAVSQVAAAIQSITGHRLTVVSTDDLPHGSRSENGTFVGIMGKFERGEIDIYMAPALLTEERFSLVESSTMSVTSYVLLTWPPSKMVNPFAFALAFSVSVWAWIFTCFFLMVIICWTIDRFLTSWRKGRKYPLTFYTWEFFTYFFPQCSNTQQAGWFRMCQVSFWVSFSLLLMIFLSSALTSSMTIKDQGDFINNYADILRFPWVRIFAEAQTGFSQMFMEPENELFRILRTKLSPVNGSFKRGGVALNIVSETENKKGVVVASPTICKALILTKKEDSGACPNVMIASASAGVMCGSILMSRRLPQRLRSLINKGVTISTEAFLHQQYLKWTLKDADGCLKQSFQNDVDGLEALSTLGLQGVFVLWGMGVLAASLSFVFETSFGRFTAASRRPHGNGARSREELQRSERGVE